MGIWKISVLFLIVSYCVFVYSEKLEECTLECEHGICQNNKCLCDPGWEGPLCQNVLQEDSACICNGHGDKCNEETGQCICHTKGVIGDHCETCDSFNAYTVDPLSSLNDLCFYDLHMDYNFTFDLSRPEDHHIRQINFFTVPLKPDIDTDFEIKILGTESATIDVSSRTTKTSENWIIRNFTGTSIKRRFSASEYTFGSSEDRTIFYVYVYNFTTPIDIILSFSQHPKLNFFELIGSFFGR